MSSSIRERLVENPPKVFISYSHDSREHQEAVLDLANRLRAEGVDADFDQYEEAPPQGWTEWMIERIEWAEWVLVICTETYERRFRRREEPPLGRGVAWEGAIISRKIYRSYGQNEKFIPVVREAAARQHIPFPLDDTTSYDLSADDGYDRLYRRLTGQTLRRPELGPPTVYPSLSPRTPKSRFVALDEPLRFWLDRVTEDHDQPVEFLRDWAGLDHLEQVYVELDLQAPEVWQPRLAGKEEAALGPLSIEELLALDRDEHRWITGRWAVLGDPGGGKTTLLRRLAATLAAGAPPQWIPLFASLPRLLDSERSLLEAVAARLRQVDAAEPVIAELERRGAKGELLLLLDGLDEVPRERKPEALELIRDLAARWPSCPLVVTSRPIGYTRPGAAFREVRLLPLDRDRRQAFLRGWFAHLFPGEEEARAADLLAELEADTGLWKLSGNPLYLTLMALLAKDGQTPHANRRRLYDQVFQFLLDGKHKMNPEPITNQAAVRRALGFLAEAMTRDDRGKEPAEPELELERRLNAAEAKEVRDGLDTTGRWKDEPRKFLAELAQRTDILGPHDGRDEPWRFWHRTFREAWAAEALAERWRAGRREEILADAAAIEGDLNRWAEPFALLAGSVDEPDELVKALVGANRELGLRALATAQGLREETLEEVLELSGDWEARSKVYPRIPELVGDGERALLLLDRLRQRTRDGNDLYFLDLAVREVARRYPGSATAAGELRQGLYDHIVPTAAERQLFERVETPRDGKVDLWCEAPAGSFWMGRPEGEEGDADELPRHEVTFTEGFRIAAVPVTNAHYSAFDPGHRWMTWEGVSEDELAHHPAVEVTWYQAVAFCRWLSAAFPALKGARLPTEEEWEYACRATTETAYWKGKTERDLAEIGWYSANSGNRTHRVGEKLANRWGLYDVHGNAWEWCLNRWDAKRYEGREEGLRVSPEKVKVDDEADASGEGRVIRGGSFRNTAYGARSACRDDRYPRDRWFNQGFRVVVPAAPSGRS